MKRSRQLRRIAHKSLISRNKGNRLFLLAVIIMVLVPVFLFLTLQSIIENVEANKKNVYGVFTDVLYEQAVDPLGKMEFTAVDLEHNLPGFNVREYGVFYTVYTETLDANKSLRLGFADEKSIELANLILLEGRLPVADHEIALTASVAHLTGDHAIGDGVDIDGRPYTLVGLVEDFGHMWPKGEKQNESRVSALNAFVSRDRAQAIFIESATLSRQVLIVRVPDISNAVEATEDFYRNINNPLEQSELFRIPTAFSALMFILSVIVVVLILSLNQKSLKKRLDIYRILGLNTVEIRYISRYEHIFLCLLGLALGIIIGLFLAGFTLSAVSSYLNQDIPLSVDSSQLALLLIIGFIANLVLVFLYTFIVTGETEGGLNRAEKKDRAEKKGGRYKRTNFYRYELRRGGRHLIALTCLLMALFSLLSYVALYKDQFVRDIQHVSDDRLPIDYDFHFATIIPSSTPSDGSEAIIFSTSSYEKQGVSQDFVDQLRASYVVEQVKVYKESISTSIMLENSDIDPYIDGLDFLLDNTYLSDLAGVFDLEAFSAHFDLAQDEMPIRANIVAYSTADIPALERSVVEGEIDYEKIISGEEVILRAPPYIREEMELANGIIAGGLLHADYLDSAAYNSSFKVGDKIKLATIVTDEIIDAGIGESLVHSFSAEENVVRVGAIIRSFGAVLPDRRTPSYISVLTFNEAFDALAIPADYSHVTVYTKHQYSATEIEVEMQRFRAMASHMMFENWQADIKTNKILNLVITIFLSVLSGLTILIAVLIFGSQLYAKTKSSLGTYFLFRINGLPYAKLVKSFGLQVLAITAVGIALGFMAHITLLVLLSGEAVEAAVEYFVGIHFANVAGSVVLIVLISIIPSLILLRSSKQHVFPSHGE